MAETEISRFIKCSEWWRRHLAKFEKISQMLFSVIDELNQLRPTEERLEKDLETPLAGDSGRLDSAGLINLIVVAEQKTAEELGMPILLTDDRTMSQVNQVFRTLGTLADYIYLLLNENRDG
jgi:acyl carrier protein